MFLSRAGKLWANPRTLKRAVISSFLLLDGVKCHHSVCTIKNNKQLIDLRLGDMFPKFFPKQSAWMCMLKTKSFSWILRIAWITGVPSFLENKETSESCNEIVTLQQISYACSKFHQKIIEFAGRVTNVEASCTNFLNNQKQTIQRHTLKHSSSLFHTLFIFFEHSQFFMYQVFRSLRFTVCREWQIYTTQWCDSKMVMTRWLVREVLN